MRIVLKNFIIYAIATIEFPNPNHEEYQFKLTDLSGKVMKTICSITECKIEIDRDGLMDGLYLIELRGPYS